LYKELQVQHLVVPLWKLVESSKYYWMSSFYHVLVGDPWNVAAGIGDIGDVGRYEKK
jgi:hypothetical protein